MYLNTNVDELRKKLKKTLELENVDIPYDIKISTMTIEAKLNTEFYGSFDAIELIIFYTSY